MNKIEQTISEKMASEKFQKVVSDDMSFANNLIDQRDINKYYAKKEAENDACNK